MSRIWKRKDRDTWIVDYRDADGMRRRLTANSRAEAETLLATKVKESRESIPGRPDIEIPTLAQYAERWLRVVATRLKPKTVLSYGQLLSVHILPALGAVTLCEVQRMQVKRLLAEKRSAGLSKNTVRLIRATISTLFAEAQDDGIVKANPAALVARRRGSASADGLTSAERHKAIRPLSEAELHAVLMAAHNDFGYYALFLTLARCGIRPGEALGLRWEDLDLEKRELLIERAFSAGHLGTTKTGTVRRVDMSQELAATLARLYTLREKQTLEQGGGEIPEWVFCNNLGSPLDESRVRKVFARILRQAGQSGHVVYDLRHTFATLLLAKGVPITYVASQLGHARPTTTLQWYSHWLPNNDKSFVDALDRSAEFLAPRVGTKDEQAGQKSQKPLDFIGATRRIRTDDLLITNAPINHTEHEN